MKRAEEYFLSCCPFLDNIEKLQIHRTASPSDSIRDPFPWFARQSWITPRQLDLWKDYQLKYRQKEEEFYHYFDTQFGFITFFEEKYPSSFRSLSDPPFALYYRGTLPTDEQPLAACVGARGCSGYGMDMAKYVSSYLASKGIGIVSGLASGIDSASHRGALQADGYTIAVTGCGIDECYPKENYYLSESIAEKGCIFTEFPPGTKPLKQNFPKRNRLISGISSVLLVFEARRKSGSLITANCALEQGKNVMALPGRATDPLSEGCNMLIRAGAGILIDPEDVILSEFSNLTKSASDSRHSDETSKRKNRRSGNAPAVSLTSDEQKLYDFLDYTPCELDILLEKSGFSFSKLSMALLSLEEKGCVIEPSPGMYVKQNMMKV